MTRKVPRLLLYRPKRRTHDSGPERQYAETLWTWSKRNIILIAVPNDNTRKCLGLGKRKKPPTRSRTLIYRLDYDFWMRKRSSPRSQARTCGKTPTIETLSILTRRPRRFTQGKLNPYSLSILLLFLYSDSIFLLYHSYPYPSFTTVQPWRWITSLHSRENDPIKRPKYVVKLPILNLNFCRENVAEDLGTSINCLLHGNVTDRLLCRLDWRFLFCPHPLAYMTTPSNACGKGPLCL